MNAALLYLVFKKDFDRMDRAIAHGAPDWWLYLLLASPLLGMLLGYVLTYFARL